MTIRRSGELRAFALVALVGESGGGKSTILKLLFRSYDLQAGQGRILIDDQDIRDVTQTSLRRAIGVVPQETALFNSTIGYNIGYGKFGCSQAEIEAAARAAQLHDRIMSFPEGYETKVGELGVRLSGGEKQRVPMAGTFLKVTRDKVCLKHCRSFLLQDAPILALDEAISSLDTGTGKGDSESAPGTGALAQIVNHDGENNSPLSQLHGKSSITIAHRVSAIVSADCILVLKDGGMVESGSHDSLLAKHGVFAAMWAKQVTKEYDEPTWKPMPDSAPGRRHEA